MKLSPDQIRRIRANSDNYVELAVRTESRDFTILREKLRDVQTHGPVLKYIIEYLESLRKVGRAADTLKRVLFYNKPADMLPMDPVKRYTAPPPHDIVERAQDEDFIRLLHALLGVVSEYGEEIAKVLENYLVEGASIDWVNVSEEIGDGNWYAALGTSVTQDNIEITLNELMTRNIQKLAERYGDKFSDVCANNPDTEAERLIPEGRLAAEESPDIDNDKD